MKQPDEAEDEADGAGGGGGGGGGGGSAVAMEVDGEVGTSGKTTTPLTPRVLGLLDAATAAKGKRGEEDIVAR